MKMNHDELCANLQYLRISGLIVVCEIRIDDGVNVINYTNMSECPPEHRDGYRRALIHCRDVYIRDVAYIPILAATSRANSIASFE
jgi:hypothetical protein